MYTVAERLEAGDKVFIHHTEEKVVVARWPLEHMNAGIVARGFNIGEFIYDTDLIPEEVYSIWEREKSQD
jgi:hypothetical protein